MKNKINCCIIIFLILFFFNNALISTEDIDNIILPEKLPNKSLFADNYSIIYSGAKLRFPPMKLNIALDTVSNINKFKSFISLTDEMEKTLKTQGCLVIPFNKHDEFSDVYYELIENDIPIFITSDTFLFYFYYYFISLFTNLEEQYFYNDLVQLTDALINKFTQLYESQNNIELKEAMQKNLILFSIANKLLNPESHIPDIVKNDVIAEYNIIQNVFKNKNLKSTQNINYYQLIPNGHYLSTPKLQKYYQGIQLLRQLFLPLNNLPPLAEGKKIPKNIKLNALQILLVSAYLNQITIKDKTALDIWKNIFFIYSFFQESINEPTIIDSINIMQKIFGNKFNINNFLNEDKLIYFLTELKKLTISNSIFEQQIIEKGIRFFPAAYNLDSIIFDNLTQEKAGKYNGKNRPIPFTLHKNLRSLPRSLDIMSLLGASKATNILQDNGDTSYDKYNEQLNKFKKELINNKYSDWHRNFYWSWLYLVKYLLRDFAQGYPPFMKSEQWYSKELQTGLSSWLLMKNVPSIQSTTIELNLRRKYETNTIHSNKKITDAFIEPVPDFYCELLAITKMIHKSLRELNLLTDTSPFKADYIEDTLTRIIEITKKELRLEALTDNDILFIQRFVNDISFMTLKNNANKIKLPFAAITYNNNKTNQILLNGTGYANLLIIIYITPDKGAMFAAGPVFSFYEFKQTKDSKIMIDKWYKFLDSNPSTILNK